MKEEVVYINTSRDTYGAKAAMDYSITIGELIAELNQYPDDTKVVYRNDNGYTFGIISTDDIECGTIDEDE